MKNNRWDNPSAPSSEATEVQSPPRQRGALTALNWVLKLTLPVVVIAAGVFGMWQLVSTKPEVNRRPPSEKSYAVQVIKAEPASIQPDIVLFGTVSAARKVDLRALVSGEVAWVNPDLNEGAVVENGTDLVRIDPFNYEGAVREAEANLAEAKAKLTETTASLASDESALKRLVEQRTFAQNDLQRAQTLVESGSLTKQALETRKLTLSQREQAVEARENNLTVLKARVEQQNANIERLNWRLEQARRNLRNTTLKAPFTGVVQTRNVELGRLVSSSDTLVSLYDPDQMDVRFTLSDSQYGRLISDESDLLGRDIEVNWKLGDVVQTNKATIERVTPEVNAANGGIDVYARIASSSGLRTGTFVELVVPDKTYESALSIPQAALYTGDIVYLNQDGRMAPQKVDILAYLGDRALVDASVFPKGSQIITTRVAEAGPGLKLVIPGQSEETGPRGNGKRGNGERGNGSRSKGEVGKPEGARRPGGEGAAQ